MGVGSAFGVRCYSSCCEDVGCSKRIRWFRKKALTSISIIQPRLTNMEKSSGMTYLCTLFEDAESEHWKTLNWGILYRLGLSAKDVPTGRCTSGAQALLISS